MSQDSPDNGSWLRGAALYQVYPLSFLDRNGDGWGDLDGVLEGLDHIASLGVDALWISPFYPSPMKDFGYDITDHRAVDPRMGSLATFDRIVAEAHRHGLKLLVDLVCGHTSDEHPWFAASRRSREGEFANRYVWADPSPDGTPPNNWLSVFGGAAWSWEPRRRQYYLHHFLSSQPALNLRDEATLQAILDTASFWLERGVDGFRIDAVDFFGHDPQLRSNPPAAWTGAEPPAKPFALQRHIHDMMHPSIREVLARLRSVVDRYPGRVLLGELSSQPGAGERIAAYCGSSGLHAAYTLSIAKQPLTAAAFAGAMTALTRPELICWSLSNHDVERAASRWLPLGSDPERFNALLAALFCTLPGTVCLYQGEELALPGARLERDQLRDPFGITYWPEFKGRDGSRTPMPWHGDRPHAGFTRAGEPWLPVPDDHHALAVDRQERLPNSPLELWRRMLNMRRNHLALTAGTVEEIEEKGSVLAFERRVEGECLLLVFNLGNVPAEYSLRRKPKLLPLDLPRLPSTPGPEITAGGTLVLPPLAPFLALLRRG